MWILGDQLLLEHPALTIAEQQDPSEIDVVIVESWKRATSQPYHKQKIVLLFSAMRHYANRLRDRGYTVHYIETDDTILSGIREYIKKAQPARIITMAAADFNGRRVQEQLGEQSGVDVDVIPNTQFLVGQFNPFADSSSNERRVMENFYRSMRKHFDILMDGDKPVGDEWNFDKENREALPDDIEIPELPHFERDDITADVIALVESKSLGIGSTELFNYAVTHEQANAALEDFLQTRFELFGPYEDAMTARNSFLFHSVLSPYLNIGLLQPMQVILRAEEIYKAGDVPINSVEGFIRQILGWREYMYTRYWELMPELRQQNHWNADRELPQFLWDGDTDMNCIAHIVQHLHAHAYSHHIERLMVISNFCLLIGVKPQVVVDWFKAFFIDAYDWVMQPNTVGMGLNADGGKIATKPYIASANYINKMSDYCSGCSFKHTKRTGDGACPFNYLYWNFLIQNEDALRKNPRSGRNVLGLRYLDQEERTRVQAQAAHFMENLNDYHIKDEGDR
ncbi:MAG: cryptochrome/photolyase family protein [Chloroflexota bacterium]